MKQQRKYNRRYEDSHPWVNFYKNISSRCTRKGSYKNRGIKNMLNTNLVKIMWERDKAYLMTNPSVDRIDTDGDYSFENCRFIEYSINNSRPKSRFARTNPYRGVCKYRIGGWRVQLTKNKKAHYGGIYQKVEDAIEASKKLSQQLTA